MRPEQFATNVQAAARRGANLSRRRRRAHESLGVLLRFRAILGGAA
jgi:hypothetical protein